MSVSVCVCVRTELQNDNKRPEEGMASKEVETKILHALDHLIITPITSITNIDLSACLSHKYKYICYVIC